MKPCSMHYEDNSKQRMFENLGSNCDEMMDTMVRLNLALSPCLLPSMMTMLTIETDQRRQTLQAVAMRLIQMNPIQVSLHSGTKQQ